MPPNFYLITPCGGSIDEVRETVRAASDVARAHAQVEFVHYLVFNNGLTPEKPGIDHPVNYQLRVSDLGDVGSRAAARNAALDQIAEAGLDGLVCFMDAGDLLVAEGAIETAFATAQGSYTAPTETLWAFSARIVGSDVSSTRKPRPLILRRINNPFFIGATFVTTDLATQARLGEGAKEDWKYWLELLDADPTVTRRSEIAYEYRVVSTTDHLNRKRRLLIDQYQFFADYLGYGHGLRTTGSLVAHIAIAGTSWVRRSNRLRPWTRRTT